MAFESEELKVLRCICSNLGGSSGGGVSVDPQCMEDDTLDNGTVIVNFVRHTVYDAATGLVTSVYDTEQDMLTAYVPVGTVTQCDAVQPTNVTPETSNVTPIRQTVVGAGSTVAGIYSATFINVGDGDATVAGQPLIPGEEWRAEGYYDYGNALQIRLGAITYDGTGTTLRISTIA